MPRKTRLLPYSRETKSGRLEYVRRVPPELQKYLNIRRYLTQVLPVEGTNVRERAVIRYLLNEVVTTPLKFTS